MWMYPFNCASFHSPLRILADQGVILADLLWSSPNEDVQKGKKPSQHFQFTVLKEPGVNR